MNCDELIKVDLTPSEQDLLVQGLVQWGGPHHRLTNWHAPLASKAVRTYGEVKDADCASPCAWASP